MRSGSIDSADSPRAPWPFLGWEKRHAARIRHGYRIEILRLMVGKYLPFFRRKLPYAWGARKSAESVAEEVYEPKNGIYSRKGAKIVKKFKDLQVWADSPTWRNSFP
jgi:hypothetical protein